MTELTKEWLLRTIAELEEERDSMLGVVNEDAAMALAAMKLALASLEAEAVADVVAWSSPNEERTCDVHLRRHDIKPGPLYAAPPAQAVPEVYNIGDATMRHIFTPAGITDVSDMQAVFDQIETVLAGIWQPAPVSLTEEQRAMLRDMDDEIVAELDEEERICRAAMLQGADGNSPVIPDGWKLVPIDPTKDMLRAGQSVVGFWLNTVHCYSKMLAAAPAAPQQEAKNV
ncbi:hypothetical protein [Enterobacter cloacae]|uniref:hypothetical protein n=1 Tax=Enterobacter cloacae TaxID=550 RepID=UPI003D249F40